MADFQELLEKQKVEQDKEQIAISEAAQTYALQIQKELGLGQEFIKREGISNAAVSVVQNFQSDLDLIADADFTGFKDIMEKYKSLLNELDASGRFDNKEKKYISDVIAPVLAEVYPLANAFTAVKFGLRDFIKQFKPLKLAATTLGGIPILGTAITKKIERQEAGEEALRRAERKKGQDIARLARQDIESSLSESTTTPSQALQTRDELDDDLSQYTADDMVLGRPVPSTYGRAKGKVPGMLSASASEEQRDELADEQRDQFEESKNLWETIAENTEETVDILKESQKNKEGGIGDTVGDIAKGALGTGAALGTGKVASKLLGKKGGETVAKKAGGKILGKTLFKSAIKKIPIIGAIAGIGFGLGRLMSGDVKGAALEVGSGLASTVPGVGTAASIGADVALAKMDMDKANQTEKEIQTAVEGVEQNAQADTRTMSNAITADLVNIDSKRTNLRMNLETGNLENMMNKMLPKEPQNNNVIAPVNTLNNASNTTVLPNMSNKNLDDTIIAIKNVY